MVLGLVAFSLAAVDFRLLPFLPGQAFLPGANGDWWFGSCSLVGGRLTPGSCSSLIFASESMFWELESERRRLLNGLRQRPELGIEVVGWTGQIVTGSDGSLKELGEIGENGDWLADRFEWGPVADTQPLDLAMKVAILQKESEQETVALPNRLRANPHEPPWRTICWGWRGKTACIGLSWRCRTGAGSSRSTSCCTCGWPE